MMIQTLVFKIPNKLNQRLGEIAELEERSKAFLIRKAVERFVEFYENETIKTRN